VRTLHTEDDLDDAEEREMQESLNADGVRFRASKVMSQAQIDGLSTEERRARNKTSAQVPREEFRIDGYRPEGGGGHRFEFCKAFNSPAGPLWCAKQTATRDDMSGLYNDVPGCASASGVFTAHGCCRCGSLTHPWSECSVKDEDLPTVDQEALNLPARTRSEREDHKKDKRDKYMPQQQIRRRWT
jgi:hypothetical protein